VAAPATATTVARSLNDIMVVSGEIAVVVTAAVGRTRAAPDSAWGAPNGTKTIARVK
jgi:hypothetical protein